MSRYIKAEDVANAIYHHFPSIRTMADARGVIEEAPSIDIVQCQDCKHWVYNFNGCARNPCTEPWYATDFYNYGERESK